MPANLSMLKVAYGGHFFDAIFTMLGHPDSLQALTINQFKEIELIETGEILKHTTADQIVLNGQFGNGAVLSVHIEAGKRNNYGMQLDLTGSHGDLKISNSTSFGNEFNVIEGAQGDAQPLQILNIPVMYNWLPTNDLGGSQLELANLYAAIARDVNVGSNLAPTFADALIMHELIECIEESNLSGARISLK